MRGILGLVVIASVVFGASLTSINTHRGTGKYDRKSGTWPLPTIFASNSTGQTKSFICSNFISHVNFPQKCLKSLNIVNVPRSKRFYYVNHSILGQKRLYQGPKDSGVEQRLDILPEREMICFDLMRNIQCECKQTTRIF